MRTAEAMAKEVRITHPNENLDDIAKKMKQYDVGVMPVVEEDKVVGVLTDRDIIIRAIAEGKKPQDVKARDAMSTNVITINENEEIKKAGQLMKENQVRRLVVLDDNNKLTGMFSLGDLATAHINEKYPGEVLEEVSKPEQ